MDQPQFRRTPAPDGVVNRGIDRDCGYRDQQQTRRRRERAELLRHPARDGARRWQRAVSRIAARPYPARVRIFAGRAEGLADFLLRAAQRHRNRTAALDKPNRRIGVVGLGAGTLAAWGRPGDTFRFYEINPDVEQIARTWFSFLADSKAQTEVVLGDARVQLERELALGRSRDFDLIAVDAFSSDSIPMHLLTAECADIYRQRLAPGGVLALHISNRALNLDPVARGMARYLGWTAVQIISADDTATGESTSRWVLLTSNQDFLERAGLARHLSGWSNRAPIVWTDDFASLWHVLNF